MPCCTDRLSLMAGTYGSVGLGVVRKEKPRLATQAPGGLPS